MDRQNGTRHMARLPGYSVRKAAQVAAFFAIKQGGGINILKLAKLIYLADREFLSRYDHPILYDKLVSMPHGPVNSLTLNYVNGYIEDPENWDEYVSDREGHGVGVSRPDLGEADLTELSKAEIGVLGEVWQRFGRMSPYQLRNYTHENCPEWEDPQGSSNPIPYERILKYLGKDPKLIEALEEALDDDRALSSALG